MPTSHFDRREQKRQERSDLLIQPAPALQPKTCASSPCTVEFTPKAANALYCSVSCRNRVDRRCRASTPRRRASKVVHNAKRRARRDAERAVNPVPCAREGCGEEFVVTHGKRRLCPAHRRGARPASVTLACARPACGQTFTTTRTQGPTSQRFCSAECQKSVEKIRETHKRRARLVEATTDQTTLDGIEARAELMRNTWCHICCYPIEAGEPVHLDHKVPLSRGGSDLNENVGPSHGHCNVMKNARTLYEVLFDVAT